MLKTCFLEYFPYEYDPETGLPWSGSPTACYASMNTQTEFKFNPYTGLARFQYPKNGVQDDPYFYRWLCETPLSKIVPKGLVPDKASYEESIHFDACEVFREILSFFRKGMSPNFKYVCSCTRRAEEYLSYQINLTNVDREVKKVLQEILEEIGWVLVIRYDSVDLTIEIPANIIVPGWDARNPVM